MKKGKFIFAFILMSAIVFLSFNIKIRANSVTPVNVENFGYYYIKNKTTGLYLQDSSINNLVNDANAIQSNYNDGDKQIFKFMNLNTNVYEIYSELNTNKCLCVQSTFNVNNAGIGFEDAGMAHPINHRFKFVDTGDGDDSYYILTATSQFNRYVTASSSGVGAYLVQRNYSSSEHNKWYLEGINLNDIMTINLNVGETRTFKYLVPDNLMYAAETTKYDEYDVDTILSIYNLEEDVVIDDDGGNELYYSYIGFRNQANKVIKIKIELYGGSYDGYFNFQLRKQQAVLYGFEYNNLNTISDLNTPYNELINYYQVYSFVNKNTSHFLSEDDRQLQRCNSEIIFFTGHGYAGGASFLLNEDDNVTRDYLDYYEIPSLLVNKIAVWSSCYSAKIVDGTSMIDKSVEKGAKSAIGFTEDVWGFSARIFTNKLFEYLCEGETISQAALHASNHIVWPDHVHTYRIAGSSYTQIVSSDDIDALNYDDELTNLYNEMQSNNEFIISMNRDGSTRHYLSINGFMSNYFIDLVENNDGVNALRGNIQNINPSTLNILPINMSNLEDEGRVVYYIKSNIATPILIIETREKGFYDIKCKNLFDGTNVKYENIGYWE